MDFVKCFKKLLNPYVFRSTYFAHYHKKHWESKNYKWNNKSYISDKERTGSVSSYYSQSAIDLATAKKIVRLTPANLLYTGTSSDGSHIMRCAQFMQKELPVRVAHRIAGFRFLPFIVGCESLILNVHDLYIQSFKTLSETKPIETPQDEEIFSQTLRDLLDHHKDVLSLLAEGFKNCRRHIQDEELIRQFLDETLTSRLGIRMLAEHHLALHENRPNYVGIISVNMNLNLIIKQQIEIVSEMCQLNYGAAPTVIITGQTGLSFPYIEMPLEYIICELLKNAFRATLESSLAISPGSSFPQQLPVSSSTMPPIYVTLASDGTDFTIRISDHAGGLPVSAESCVWNYHFSTPSRMTTSPVEAPSKQTSLSVRQASEPIRDGQTDEDNQSNSEGFIADFEWPQVNGTNADKTDELTGYQMPPAPHSNSPVTIIRHNADNDVHLPPRPNSHQTIMSHRDARDKEISTEHGNIFDSITKHTVTKSIHGFGFGLPTCRAFASYLGGSLRIETLRNVGTDVYLRLRHIDGKQASFRI